MAERTWTIDEIEVDVSGFFTTHHHFEIREGAWGELTFPAFCDYGEFRTADGRELLMRKVHWLGSAHELLEGPIVRGTADRRGLLCREMVIQFDGTKYLLEPGGFLSQGWYLIDGMRNTLLEIQPRGIFRQGAYLMVEGPLDADLIAFAYYLVHMRLQEESAAAAAAAS